MSDQAGQGVKSGVPPRGCTVMQNGVGAETLPRLSVDVRLNRKSPAVVGVPAMRVPLLKRWMLVPGGSAPATTRYV